VSTRDFSGVICADSLREKLDTSLAVISEAGYRLGPGSRFTKLQGEFRRFAQAANGKVDPEGLDWGLLSQGIVDAYELRIITECKPIMAEHPAEIQKMLSGSTLPKDDSQTMSRDLQFQLFVASNLSLMGIPVTLEEPDVRIHYGGMTLGVAVKRVQSVARLKERLVEANKQIERQKLIGFVALGLEQMVLSGRIIVPMGPEGLAEVGHHLGDLAERETRIAIAKARASSTVGYFIWVVAPMFLPRQWTVGFSADYRANYVTRQGDACSQVAEAICKMDPPHSF